MIITEKGSKDTFLNEKELTNLCQEALEKKRYFHGKKILVIIPDTTRTAPVELFFKILCSSLLSRVKKLDFIIALGTHPPMDEKKINTHLGITSNERYTKYKDVGIFNHHWDEEKELVYIGTISQDEVRKISGGLMNEEIPIRVNKKIFDYDELLIVGPVFPHEVVGFSGGYKYLFPGVAGPEIIHKFHWLGALITNPKINGVKSTPVRDVINKAASFINTPITQFCFVVKEDKVCGFYAGDEEAWSKASDLSAQVNVKYVSRTFGTVLAVAPKMYEELWTCLLYTSPSPRDLSTSRMPSSA